MRKQSNKHVILYKGKTEIFETGADFMMMGTALFVKSKLKMRHTYRFLMF